jgi:glyoxylase-like metal-dependent hydrolase (beta-lactamase superfamily II)
LHSSRASVSSSVNGLYQISPHLFGFTDTCNVYLLVDDGAGLLIDTGSGAIVEHLDTAGVAQVEWVLHTHHHRDQCWGTPRVRNLGARVAVPEYERHLFDTATLYWQTRRTFDNYNDRNTFFAAAEDIPVDAVLEDYEHFAWRSHRFLVLPAKGHTYGSVCLISEIDGRRVAFTGDLLGVGGKLYQLHAMEYAYGGLEGILFTLQSIRGLAKQEVDLALPSHGERLVAPASDIVQLERRLMACVELGRGMAIAPQTAVPETAYLPESRLVPISRHLLWGGIWACSNFYILLSESGKALFIDYGHAYTTHMHTGPDHEGPESMRFIEHHLDELSREHGVDSVDVVIPTHIHDDHTCGIPYLQRHRGTQCWALADVAQVLERPADWASSPCVFARPIRIDRRLSDGDRVSWEEYDLQIFHTPGQTEFASTIVTTVDGRRVAFTGDNYFLADVVAGGRMRELPYQTTVMRNSFQLWMHRRCATVMRDIQPELICPGHGDPLECCKADIDTYVDFIARKEAVFTDLVASPADHFIDLFWARLLPYVATAGPNEVVPYRLLVRNNFDREIVVGARIVTPSDWSTSDDVAMVTLQSRARAEIQLTLRTPAQLDALRHLVTVEVVLDGVSQGPLAEAVLIARRAASIAGDEAATDAQRERSRATAAETPPS